MDRFVGTQVLTLHPDKPDFASAFSGPSHPRAFRSSHPRVYVILAGNQPRLLAFCRGLDVISLGFLGGGAKWILQPFRSCSLPTMTHPPGARKIGRQALEIEIFDLEKTLTSGSSGSQWINLPAA